jgi:hypothetical protein
MLDFFIFTENPGVVIKENIAMVLGLNGPLEWPPNGPQNHLNQGYQGLFSSFVIKEMVRTRFSKWSTDLSSTIDVLIKNLNERVVRIRRVLTLFEYNIQ